MKPIIPKELLERIKTIKAKRPRTVLEHILAHGFITTEELKEKYGYNHPPRAARDVVEQGIRLKKVRVKGSDGRKIASYSLDLDKALDIGKAGRRQYPAVLKKALLEAYGPRCAICGGTFQITFLQVDHKIPFEVAGESEAEFSDAFMLVCASCNRTKSWTCEHCKNWTEIKNVDICKSCYWASPMSYQHVAMAESRRVDVTWESAQVAEFERFRRFCEKSGLSIQDGIKKGMARLLK